MKKEILIEFIEKYTKVFAALSIFAFGMFLIYVVNVNSPNFVSVGLIVLLCGLSSGVSIAFLVIKSMVLEIDDQGV